MSPWYWFAPREERAPEPLPVQSWLGHAALLVARRELGQGEQGMDNDGPAVRRYARMTKAPGDWCAAFVVWCIEEAAQGAATRSPITRTHGARALLKRVRAVGSAPSVPLPGDVVCWWRISLKNWRGHTGIVSRVDGNAFWSIEANRGRYPSKVREYGHELGEDRLLGFARLP